MREQFKGRRPQMLDRRPQHGQHAHITTHDVEIGSQAEAMPLACRSQESYRPLRPAFALSLIHI
eukprot:12804687-Alexandrium_andersonii.AAC.1